jgi:hypothetical protein
MIQYFIMLLETVDSLFRQYVKLKINIDF